jgi:hypothetical protein
MKRRIIESGTVPGIESPIVHYLVALALRHRSRQSICSGFSRAGLMQERKVQTHACVLRIKRHVQIERPGWRREREWVNLFSTVKGQWKLSRNEISKL